MKRRPSRWLQSCAMLSGFCLLVVFLMALVINEHVPDTPPSSPYELANTETLATAYSLQTVTPIVPLSSTLSIATATSVPATPAFVGGAGLVLTSEAIVQSTKVESYRDSVRATWTTAAQTMEPFRAQMTLTATLWQR